MTQITKGNKKDSKHTISSAIHSALSSHIFIKEKKFIKAIEKAAGNLAKKIAKIAKEKTAPKPAVKKTASAAKTVKAKAKPAVKKAVNATKAKVKPAVKKVVTAAKTKAKPAVKKAAPKKKPAAAAPQN